MKIGLVCPYAEGFGGVQEHVFNLAKAFKRKGHEVKVIMPRNPKFKTSVSLDGVEIFVGKGKTIGINGTQSCIAIGVHYEPRIKEILKRENFDVIHLHQPDVPTIPWFFLAQSKATNVVTFHRSGDYSPVEKAIYYLLSPTALALERKIHGRIAVSKTAKEHAEQYFNGSFKIIPNGIDTKRFSPKGNTIRKYQNNVSSVLKNGVSTSEGRRFLASIPPRFNRGFLEATNDKINVIFVGRFEERKGLIYLLKAFAKAKAEMDSLRLIIVGDGPKRAEYEEFIAKKRVKDVYFEGAVEAEKLDDYYRTADIFCAPSTHGESFGIVLLEALSTGVPVIATSIPGYKELLSDYPSKQCLVVPKNINALKEALLKLAKDKELREKISAWGPKKADKYSWDKVADEVLKVYKLSQKQKKDLALPGAFWLRKQLIQVESMVKKTVDLIDSEIM
ncbi:glycosyltransferase family 4 protein [Patescibacteria group bacterium]|nr:glycosyltransferase family 4 protein [Patescibacteria group bacterium]